MSMSSFALPCHCNKCCGKLVHLELVGPGQWMCPNGHYTCVNMTVQDRAKRDLQKETAKKREVK
jgi:hypothetical protein